MKTLEETTIEVRSKWAFWLLAITGYLLALFFCEPMIFSRFGSLIVCVGIYFSAQGLLQILDVLQDALDKEVSDVRAENDRCIALSSREKDHNEAALTQLKIEQEKTIIIFESERRKNLSSIKMRILKLESLIVSGGTLIWGFGDYLVPKLAPLCPC